MKIPKGLRCGIEIHQQLDTRKLFCACATGLSDEGHGAYRRRLKPVSGELGAIDRAAMIQYKKGVGFEYQTVPGLSCLVDLDEEPPVGPDADAVRLGLTFSAMIGADVVDEIHFMRKIVVDGSNTTGYQRSALISVGGHVDIGHKKIGILTTCLEEDAARKISEEKGIVTYRLDRLGIPLLEIATAPDMETPEEVREAALRIGTMLRATKGVKRGIGTIREDLNISIPGGARVEIKGAQELRLLPAYVENEAKRQAMLIEIKGILGKRGAVAPAGDAVDVSDAFGGCGSKVISSALSSGGIVCAVALPGFAGTLNGSGGKYRLGAELAQRARVKAGVKGIFHSDELPGYGIGEGYVKAVFERLGLKGEHDAFAICADRKRKAEKAIAAVAERAAEALSGVPEETRDPMPDGTSRYSRPLPGADRMSPETDIPPIAVDRGELAEIAANLPEMPEETEARLVSAHGINAQQASVLVATDRHELFERLVSGGAETAIAAATLTNTYSELEREGTDTQSIDGAHILRIFEMLSQGAFAKEAVPELVKKAAEGVDPDKAVESLGLSAVGQEEARDTIAKIVSERADFVRERGMSAVGPLMGPVMGALRGKIDGGLANSLLTEEIKRLLAEGK
ncbi:MAG: Glu-tRNA(Gln) amidotransferase subunit GatE [Thermoplasmatales archaeon]|nr:Glu-tRNA(Gln) amidotransferase subunit GatE [Thermoplasmatales archaeon]